MSLNLKSSVSMATALMSSLAFVACAKNSDNKQVAPAAAPVQTAAQVEEVKKDAAKRDCPEIMGTYADSLGKQSVFAMASIAGGITFTQVDRNNTIVDGKPHEYTDATAFPGQKAGSKYVAVCKDGEVQTVMTNAAGETFGKISFKVTNEAGDVQMSQEIDGIATTAMFKKVKDVVPTAAVEPVAPADPSAPDAVVEKSADTTGAPATPTAPAEASAPAMELPAAPVVEISTAPIHIPAIVDRETHSPVDTPAQVAADSASDAGTAPPMPEAQPAAQPEAQPSQPARVIDMPDYYPDPRSNKHGFKGN